MPYAPSNVFSAAIIGLNAQIIEVEVNASYGLRHFNIVGLPDKAVQEAKERVGAAIESAGFPSPHRQPVRVLVSLAPADIKKEGAIYDLSIAVGYLLAAKKIRLNTCDKMFLGELALDGRLRKVRGALVFAMAAKEKGFKEIILPKENENEANLVGGIKVVGLENLKDVIAYLEGKKNILAAISDIKNISRDTNYNIDFSHIKGQEYAKRALEIVAAGAHNLAMQGPPGTGKTLLAKTIPTILPPLSSNESLEVTKIYSIAGLLPDGNPLITARPFRSPHHTSSSVALIGGGNPPRPGEITLAHRGVLFLDEFPEFHRDVLESLRQPIEEGNITLLRARHSLTLPSRFTMVLSSNPCPCGHYGNPENQCRCTNSQVQMYRRKLSGPLMDRIDISITVPPVKYEKLAAENQENCSYKIREKVGKARDAQRRRFGAEKTNSEIDIPQIKKYCHIDSTSQNLLKKFVDSGKLSARGYHRVLKVARTIADLDASENILFSHLSEAIMYRVREED